MNSSIRKSAPGGRCIGRAARGNMAFVPKVVCRQGPQSGFLTKETGPEISQHEKDDPQNQRPAAADQAEFDWDPMLTWSPQGGQQSKSSSQNQQQRNGVKKRVRSTGLHGGTMF